MYRTMQQNVFRESVDYIIMLRPFYVVLYTISAFKISSYYFIKVCFPLKKKAFPAYI